MIEKALSQYGVIEYDGDAHNEQILKYFVSANQMWVRTDETSWCSAYVNWVAKESGYEHTNKLNARSWLEVGEAVSNPKIGDLVILWRVAKDDWRGHVGFFINETDTHINVLGGNQSNMVRISPYPISRLLGYRRLRK